MTGYNHMERDFPVLFALHCRTDVDHNILLLCFRQLSVIILAKYLVIFQDRFPDLWVLFDDPADLRILRKMGRISIEHGLKMIGEVFEEHIVSGQPDSQRL